MMTYDELQTYFIDSVMPYIIDMYEQDGVPDRPARREEWNNMIDGMIKDREIPEEYGEYCIPDWLETKEM